MGKNSDGATTFTFDAGWFIGGLILLGVGGWSHGFSFGAQSQSKEIQSLKDTIQVYSEASARDRQRVSGLAHQLAILQGYLCANDRSAPVCASVTARGRYGEE